MPNNTRALRAYRFLLSSKAWCGQWLQGTLLLSLRAGAVGCGQPVAAIRYAAALPMKDFEDAMQIAAARSCGASRIVTRNIKDYERSPIPAITHQQALSRLPTP
ncbi:MAG: PIN domain-containing protein [Gammaproteobacteria bacterium]|nr:PIN domain-containing protein [Gammaproteobacteria bacterium]